MVAVQAPSAMRSVEISGRFGSEPWTHRVALHGGAASDAVHVLWARRRIDDWLARLSLGDDTRVVRDA